MTALQMSDGTAISKAEEDFWNRHHRHIPIEEMPGDRLAHNLIKHIENRAPKLIDITKIRSLTTETC